MDKRPELIERYERARAEMRVLLDHIDRNRKLYPLWTIREILAHISGWDDAIIASLRSHIAGDVPEITAPRGIDDYNARTVETREGLGYDLILREYEATRETLKQILREMPEEKFAAPFVLPWGGTGTIAEVIADFAEHEHVHAQEIKEIIEKANR